MKNERTLLTELLQFRGQQRQDTVVATGDDGYIFRAGDTLLCVSTDSFCEGVHFLHEHYSPQQIGEKVYEATVSDIAAMGGKPTSIFLSLALSEKTPEEYLPALYRGIEQRAIAHGVEIGGGETTSHLSDHPLITVTALGIISGEEAICPRSGAELGDKIYVTGNLGGSAAGFKALTTKVAGFQKLKDIHLTPRARVDLVDTIAPLASSMIDISDGLSSEIHHICKASNCGAVINADLIPIDAETKELASLTGVRALDFALGGGEDFELLFTSSQNIDTELAHCIGEITGNDTILLQNKDKKEPLIVTGYQHFTPLP